MTFHPTQNYYSYLSSPVMEFEGIVSCNTLSLALNHQKDDINKIIEKGALSMGISNGIIKGDIVINNNQPFIIELAARLSGVYFCTHEIPLSTGVDLISNAIIHS